MAEKLLAQLEGEEAEDEEEKKAEEDRLAQEAAMRKQETQQKILEYLEQ